jgi:hypothetical protein
MHCRDGMVWDSQNCITILGTTSSRIFLDSSRHAVCYGTLNEIEDEATFLFTSQTIQLRRQQCACWSAPQLKCVTVGYRVVRGEERKRGKRGRGGRRGVRGEPPSCAASNRLLFDRCAVVDERASLRVSKACSAARTMHVFVHENARSRPRHKAHSSHRKNGNTEARNSHDSSGDGTSASSSQ